MQSNNNEIISVHIQDTVVKHHNPSLDDPLADASNTFKAGFFTGAAATALLLASVSWIFI